MSYVNRTEIRLFYYECSDFIIRPISDEDINQLYKWRTNSALNKYMFSPPPATFLQQIKWYKEYAGGGSEIYYMVYQKRHTQQPIGYCQLVKIDWINKTAESGLVIDPTRISSKMISIKSGMAMLKIAFEFLNLETVYSSVHHANSPSRHFFESLINSSVIEGEHPYRKKDEILYKTPKALYESVKSTLLGKNNKRWNDTLNMTAHNTHCKNQEHL